MFTMSMSIVEFDGGIVGLDEGVVGAVGDELSLRG